MKTERQHQKELLGAIINTYNLSKEEVIDLVEDVFAKKVMSNGTIEVGYYAFAGGKFSQKDIYLKYTMEGQRGTHSFKSGYYNNPASMANNTSRGGLHFISRASVVNALSPGRQLGFSYRFYNKRFFANQGAFAENEYNDQPAGFQGNPSLY